MPETKDNLKEKLADLAAFLILLIFVAAMVLGMIDHTYQPPAILQALVGIIGTFFFGHRFIPPVDKGAKSNEIAQGSSGDKSDNLSDNRSRDRDVDQGRPRDSSSSGSSGRLSRPGNLDGGLRPWPDADDDS